MINKYRDIKQKSRKLTKYRKSASKSKGEMAIAEFLKNESIYFESEWYFKGLYNYNRTTFLYFDFYIPDYNLVIEYDGKQHYNSNKMEHQKVNDFLKNAFCKKNGINLLRIKYIDFNNIENIICKCVDNILGTP